MKWRSYPRYKDSDIEWLGEIPEHWNADRLKWSVLSIRNGIWGAEPDGINDLPCVRVADFDRVRFSVSFSAPTVRAIALMERDGRLLKKGDLLLEKSGGGELQPVGVVVLYDHQTPAVCSNFIARLRVPDGVDSRFWVYMHAHLYSAQVNTRSIKQTTGIQNLDADSYLNEVVPYPPFAEQRAIAAFLDRETARIDALIEKKERQIELLQEKRAAVISHAVTNGLDSNVKMKDSSIEWLGKIPEHWEVIPLRWYLRIGSGSFLSNTEFVAEPTEGLDIPVIGGNGIMGFTDKANIGKTTIAIGRVGVYCGNVHLVKAPAWVTDNALMLYGIRAFEVEYLSLLLKVLNLNRLANQNTQPLVTGTMIKGQRVPLPPISEQRAIAAFLAEETARIDALIEKIRKSIDLLREYRTALITAAVTGKIDVREEVA